MGLLTACATRGETALGELGAGGASAAAAQYLRTAPPAAGGRLLVLAPIVAGAPGLTVTRDLDGPTPADALRTATAACDPPAVSAVYIPPASERTGIEWFRCFDLVERLRDLNRAGATEQAVSRMVLEDGTRDQRIAVLELALAQTQGRVGALDTQMTQVREAVLNAIRLNMYLDSLYTRQAALVRQHERMLRDRRREDQTSLRRTADLQRAIAALRSELTQRLAELNTQLQRF